MAADGFTLFSTAIGTCAVAWSAEGIVGVQLPESGERATRARMLRRFAGAREAAPPPQAARAIQRIAALMAGEKADLGDIALDMSGVPAFNRQVYDIARAIPPGETMTYGAIAERLGERGLARAVGQALGRNPFAIIVPCHRVLAAGDKIGGFSASGGTITKRRMLVIEGALEAEAPTLFDDAGTTG